MEQAEKWIAGYKKAKKKGTHCAYLMEALDGNLLDSFVEDIPLTDYICDVLIELRKKRWFDDMHALYKSAKKHMKKLDKAFFLDYYCIDYYLYKNRISGIKKHLNGFLQDPVGSIDIFLPIYDKIVYYGHRQLAVAICTSLIDKLTNAPGLIAGAEEDFTKTMVSETMQELYCNVKNEVEIDKNEVISEFQKYGYTMSEEDIDQMIRIWSDAKPKGPDFDTYEKDASYFEWEMMLTFMDYMAAKKVNFATAYDIWNIGSRCFQNRILSGNPSDSFDDMFAFDEENYADEIYGRMDSFFSNKTTCAHAVAWGLQYVYDFLVKGAYISDEIHQEACETIQSNMMEIIDAKSDSVWEYNFLFKWGKPDCMDKETFDQLKELYQDSFEFPED